MPRALEPEHRQALRRQLKLEADSGRFNPLRNRALFLLAWGSAVRLNECLALTVGQVLELTPVSRVLGRRRDGKAKATRTELRWRVRSSSYLRTTQAKGGVVAAGVDGKQASTRTWTSAGTIVITATARRALHAYVKHALQRGALQLQPDAPLWVRASSKEPLHKRTVQYQWRSLQQRAGVPELERYHFHCLRHDSLTLFARACGGDVFRVAAFGRCDPYTAQRYVHVEPRRLAALADVAAALR